MTNGEVIKSFIDGATKAKSNNLKINGNLLVYYETTIAERLEDGRNIVNVQRYSVSTTRIQKVLLKELASDKLIRVTSVPLGWRTSIVGVGAQI